MKVLAHGRGDIDGRVILGVFGALHADFAGGHEGDGNEREEDAGDHGEDGPGAGALGERQT